MSISPVSLQDLPLRGRLLVRWRRCRLWLRVGLEAVP
jgi:hypothetical protein